MLISSHRACQGQARPGYPVPPDIGVQPDKGPGFIKIERRAHVAI